MTREEMETVAKICVTADNFCSTCVNDLFDLLLKAFPQHADIIDEIRKSSGDLEERLNKARDKFFENYEGDEPTILDL